MSAEYKEVDVPADLEYDLEHELKPGIIGSAAKEVEKMAISLPWIEYMDVIDGPFNYLRKDNGEWFGDNVPPHWED
jgi:hypothetical protein